MHALTYPRIGELSSPGTDSFGRFAEPVAGGIETRELSGIEPQHPQGRGFHNGRDSRISPASQRPAYLYHALASPNVHPATPGNTVESYPTLAELDVIENYLSLAKFRFDSERKYAIAVFGPIPPGNERRLIWRAESMLTLGRDRAHRHSEAVLRSLDPRIRADPPGQTGVASEPARYAAFIAEARRPRNTDPIMGRPDKKDLTRTFLFPVHKLFPGSISTGYQDDFELPPEREAAPGYTLSAESRLSPASTCKSRHSFETR